MAAKLKAIKVELQRRKHHRTTEVGAWLRKVVLGYYQCLFRATRHSCASLLVAFAGCGELYSYVAVNVHRWGGIDSIHS